MGQGGDYGSGDAQHYQNILLSGVDQNGEDITNEVTFLVLDIMEELGISDFPTTLRINENSDEKLLRRAAEVVRFGGGILAFYNESLILKSLTDYGYPASDAWKFANDGCWEVQIPGKTFFRYTPFDSLQILQHRTLDGYSETVDFGSFEELYKRYIVDLNEAVYQVYCERAQLFTEDSRTWCEQPPCTVVSIFEQGCIDKGLSYIEGGPVYNVNSPHIGGLPDTVNSLYAIKKLVFDEKKVTFKELMELPSP